MRTLFLAKQLSDFGRIAIFMAFALLFPTLTSANTIAVIDASSSTVYSISSSSCSGSKGNVIYTNCYGGQGGFISPVDSQGRLGFFTADVSSLKSLTFDHVFLSLTEIRSTPFGIATASAYMALGQAPSPPGLGQDNLFLLGIDSALSAGLNYMGAFTGIGVGGNRLLLDITAAVNSRLQANVTQVGFLLKDDIGNGNQLGILGNNYNSGDPNQYYASSLYEYPTLVITNGDQLTPNDQLPSRPITTDPLGPPPPTPPNPVPVPATIALLGLGLVGIGAARRKQA